MDKEQGPQNKAVGSLSRLPIIPRASRDNLRAAAIPSQNGSLKSGLPRLSSRYGSSKIVPPVPLGENLNRSLVDRFGRPDQSTRQRNRSPVRDALQAAQAAALETTPPSSNCGAPVFDENDENSVLQDRPLQKRKPRPSLTERTLETLSQISASPSPTRRRGSVASNDRAMGPPARPGSSLRGSRPNTPSVARPSSPNKLPFKPPGRMSPTKEQTFPAVPSPGSLFTSPKAFVRGGSMRPTKANGDQRSISTAVTPNQSLQTPRLYSSKTMRVKASPHTSAQQNLESLFKDPVKRSTADQSNAAGSPGSPGLLRPRSRGENVLASSPSRTKAERHKANSSKPISISPDSNNQQSPHQPPPKSSAALRETIAKAKAARKSVGASTALSTDSNDVAGDLQGYAADTVDVARSNVGLLQHRIKAATSSGLLNISAMKLDKIPDAVMKMYESNNSSINWSEMVDLTKLNAADNEILALSDEVFPDWSVAEMADDEEKTNQFGGLEGLDLHNNLLHEVPLGIRRLERLTSLNLSGNKLINQSLRLIFQIPNLQELNLSRNGLDGTIRFAGFPLPSLRTFVLSQNKIETLEINEVPTALRVLDLSSNRLSLLPWQALSELPLLDLNVSNNRLDGQALDRCAAGFHHLRELDLSQNAFSSIASCISDFTKMQVCRLNGNRLDQIPDLSNCSALITLQLAGNKLSELPSGLAALQLLRTVDGSLNNIKTIDPELASLDSLTCLELTGNPLRDRKFLTMDTTALKAELQKRLSPDTEDADRGGVAGGVDLALTSPFLYKSVNGFLDLTTKSLTGIDISKIDFDSATPPIHTLKLSNNDLTTLPFELLSHPALKWSLKSLDISHNPHLHPTDYLTEDLFLPALQSMFIVSTGMTSLDALTTHLKAPALTEINISCHRLAGHVPWVRAWFPKCTSLLASDNWFSSIDIEGVRGLEVLDIRNNYIEEVPRGIGLLGNHGNKTEPGRLRAFECGGNKFRVPRITVIEKGTAAVLKDLRRMVPASDVPEEWKDEI